MKYIKKYNEEIEWEFYEEEEFLPFIILDGSILFIYNNKVCFLISINEDKENFSINNIKEIYINDNKILFIIIPDYMNEFIIDMVLSKDYKIDNLYLTNGYPGRDKRYFNLSDIKRISNNIIINNKETDIKKFFNSELNENIDWEFYEEEEEEKTNFNDIEKIRNTFYWETGERDQKKRKLLKNIDNIHLINLIRFVRRRRVGRYGKTNSELLNIFQKELNYRKYKNVYVK